MRSDQDILKIYFLFCTLILPTAYCRLQLADLDCYDEGKIVEMKKEGKLEEVLQVGWDPRKLNNLQRKVLAEMTQKSHIWAKMALQN